MPQGILQMDLPNLASIWKIVLCNLGKDFWDTREPTLEPRKRPSKNENKNKTEINFLKKKQSTSQNKPVILGELW